ncbi:MAG: hypothetical protein JJT78_12325 [Leptospira sp.]|nr:hypothetical protein [Leptospira sp.]
MQNSELGVKTDEKKQHFDDIYIQKTPLAYKEKIMDELSYISDNFNKATFERLILPWAMEKSANKELKFVDLCCCFGNTTMATLYDMDYDAIIRNWRDEESVKSINSKRRISASTTGIDISSNALEYGKSVGLFDQIIAVDLNSDSDKKNKAIQEIENSDIAICTAALVYLEPESIEQMVAAFASGEGEGYMLVNFLNPFALEKSDATKKILINHLKFVGSMASRHRKLSPLERENYPDEEWALLEIWVLKR